jgi:hypothetical protein
MSTTDTHDIEERLRAALTARAELVQPQDLRPLAPVTELRPHWQSPWVLVATAAVVLLVLGVLFRGFDPDPRSDRLAPRPDQPRVTLPPDVGRDWKADDLSAPARLDLDGDGRKEKVEFLAEPSEQYDGRTRLQTTLSSTGEEAYGIAQLATTIGTYALDPIDADGDGDQELVLLHEDDGSQGPGGISYPMVFDLRDGLLVQMVAEDPELLRSGYVPVPGSVTTYYDLVHVQSFSVDGGTLVSTRSRSAFARGNMTLLRPETSVADRYEWTLDDDGVLHASDPGCVVLVPESTSECGPDAADDLPYVTSESTGTIGVGEEAALEDGGLGYRVRVTTEGDVPGLVVDGPGADGSTFALDVPDPQVHVVSPTHLVANDAASVFVTSATDPEAMQVVVQTFDQAGLVALRPVGEIAFGTGTTRDGRDHRTWLTASGSVVSVVEGDDGSWEAWQWVRVGDLTMAAFPWGTICFDDVEDPTTGRAC